MSKWEKIEKKLEKKELKTRKEIELICRQMSNETTFLFFNYQRDLNDRRCFNYSQVEGWNRRKGKVMRLQQLTFFISII